MGFLLRVEIQGNPLLSSEHIDHPRVDHSPPNGPLCSSSDRQTDDSAVGWLWCAGRPSGTRQRADSGQDHGNADRKTATNPTHA